MVLAPCLCPLDGEDHASACINYNDKALMIGSPWLHEPLEKDQRARRFPREVGGEQYHPITELDRGMVLIENGRRY